MISSKPHNDIVIEHRAVSGVDATVTLLFEDAIVEDLGSTNGTFIDGRKIFREKLSPGGTIANGDLIDLVGTSLRFLTR